MAELTITAGDPTGARGRQEVVVSLVDVDGQPVTGYSTAGVLVQPWRGWTSDVGGLVVDLIPNGDIAPANSLYLLKVGTRQILIEKHAGAETVQQALAVAALPLDPLVTSIDGGALVATEFAMSLDGGSL